MIVCLIIVAFLLYVLVAMNLSLRCYNTEVQMFVCDPRYIKERFRKNGFLTAILSVLLFILYFPGLHFHFTMWLLSEFVYLVEGGRPTKHSSHIGVTMRTGEVVYHPKYGSCVVQQIIPFDKHNPSNRYVLRVAETGETVVVSADEV